MHLHGPWEMERKLVDPNEFGCQVDGYLSKNTGIIFIFPIMVTLCLKYYGPVQVNEIFLQANLVLPSA